MENSRQQKMITLLRLSGAACWSIRQCEFGAETSKPTRLASNLPGAVEMGLLPWFDNNGTYMGPLDVCSHGWHPPLIGVTGDEFLTTATDPPQREQADQLPAPLESPASLNLPLLLSASALALPRPSGQRYSASAG